DSMREAIDETRRRRSIQEKFNEEHHIEPHTVRKAINDISAFLAEAHDTLDTKERKDGVFFTPAGSEAGDAPAMTEEQLTEDLKKLPRAEVERLISTLQEEMAAASESMDYEEAARVRDQLVQVKALVEHTTEEDVMRRLKAGARKGSEHATRRRYRGPRKH
ncbi:MAG: UvrB/UvrC motif-containing protein, partial [Atopobiaceae bacterium]|nr:UvrB/UvrC motif-containing protein [Atopobiaceae bacterium]